ncbi:MAG: hypothetical protein AAGF67_03350 [Verrucomicrobiota bacterium]
MDESDGGGVGVEGTIRTVCVRDPGAEIEEILIAGVSRARGSLEEPTEAELDDAAGAAGAL